jgi:predicted membrane-bound mannosyltransferase
MGLMQATKETSVIAFGAMGCALALASMWSRLLGEPRPDVPPKVRPGHLALALACGILVAVALLSSLFTNARGPLDGVLTYLPWLQRAGGASPHVQSWYYYLHILAFWHRGDGPYWSEGAILVLAAVGVVLALLPASREWLSGVNLAFARWASFYTLILTAIYSAIPYKTPWCLLSFLQGMTLLAGIGVAGLIRTMPTWPRRGLATLVVTAAAHLGWQSYQASFVYHADPANPYVYVQTLPTINRLSDDLDQLRKAAPEGNRLLIKVVWHDPYYWPLPWYLRQFENVGYWTQMPDDPTAPVVVSSPRLEAVLSERLDPTHLMIDYYGVRPNVLAQVWVRMDLWEAHLRRLGRL